MLHAAPNNSFRFYCRQSSPASQFREVHITLTIHHPANFDLNFGLKNINNAPIMKSIIIFGHIYILMKQKINFARWEEDKGCQFMSSKNEFEKKRNEDGNILEFMFFFPSFHYNSGPVTQGNFVWICYHSTFKLSQFTHICSLR